MYVQYEAAGGADRGYGPSLDFAFYGVRRRELAKQTTPARNQEFRGRADRKTKKKAIGWTRDCCDRRNVSGTSGGAEEASFGTFDREQRKRKKKPGWDLYPRVAIRRWLSEHRLPGMERFWRSLPGQLSPNAWAQVARREDLPQKLRQ